MISINKKNLSIGFFALVVLMIIAFVTSNDNIKGMLGMNDFLPAEDAAKIAIDYINENLLVEGATASLVDVFNENGLYRVHIDISGQEYDSYISKDGGILFPQNWIKISEPANNNVEPEVEVLESTEAELLAKCLTEKGFQFFGSSSCGWCNQEKTLFGDAAQYLPYVECVGEDGYMTQACQDANIESFPTWMTPDGTLVPGYKTAEELYQLSGCSL
jgi:hypothetical protein